MTTSTLVLLTAAPTSIIAWHAVNLVHALFKQGELVQVFFYQDAVSIANKLNWRPTDEANLSQAWQNLHLTYGLLLPVCVTAALNRGVSDAQNVARHQLDGANLLTHFYLTGLGELSSAMIDAKRTLQL